MEQYLVGDSGREYKFFFMPIGRREDFKSILLERTMSTYVFANEIDGAMVPVSISWEVRKMKEVFHWTNNFPEATHIGVRQDMDERMITHCAEDLRKKYFPDPSEPPSPQAPS
jgi:hypothetical protein